MERLNVNPNGPCLGPSPPARPLRADGSLLESLANSIRLDPTRASGPRLCTAISLAGARIARSWPSHASQGQYGTGLPVQRNDRKPMERRDAFRGDVYGIGRGQINVREQKAERRRSGVDRQVKHDGNQRPDMRLQGLDLVA